MSRAYDATPALADFGATHLVGIGGAGVSVVARLLASSGVPVSGSDARPGAVVDQLRAEGIEVRVGHDASAVVGVHTLVVSSAVRDDNPELLAARAAGARILHRSQALAAVMAGRRGVAVAGAHGKTTTSAMVAAILRELGADPSYAIGGSVLTDGGALPGGHLGAGDVLVAEADESDGSFLNYSPSIAVVTNVEPDHLDHYGSRAAFEAAFDAFAARVPADGILVACADDAGSSALAARRRAAGATVWTYGSSAEADVVVRDVDAAEGGMRAVLEVRRVGVGVPVGGDVAIELAVPGAHNVLNATAAALTVALLHGDLRSAAAAVAAFRGTGRRFEHRGTADEVRVVDDYAHHPTEVAALLAAARSVAGEGRVVVLFQPHLYSRTRTFASEFAAALSAADEVVVTGVYAAREEPDPSVDAGTITELITSTAAGHGAHAVEDRLAAARAAAALATPGDLLLTVGAGDVTQLADVVLDELRGREGGR